MAKISDCIGEPIGKMSLDEKGLLNILLTFGKKANEEFKDTLKDPQVLTEWGEIDISEIAEKMNESFIAGFGFGDVVADRDDNYGVQLDFVINKVLVKSLKVTKPYFKTESDSYKGAIEREKWIAEKLLESLWDRLPEEVKRELSEEIEKMLIEKGIDPLKASKTTAALITGSLTLVRSILGFKFHILLAQISNRIWKVVFGRGLSLAFNASLQRLARVFFGPIGWVITGILTIPVIAELINPREYDKYIPVVFIIGLQRLQSED